MTESEKMYEHVSQMPQSARTSAKTRKTETLPESLLLKLTSHVWGTIKYFIIILIIRLVICKTFQL